MGLVTAFIKQRDCELIILLAGGASGRKPETSKPRCAWRSQFNEDEFGGHQTQNPVRARSPPRVRERRRARSRGRGNRRCWRKPPSWLSRVLLCIVSVVEREVFRPIPWFCEFEDLLSRYSCGVISTWEPSGVFASSGSTTTPLLTVPLKLILRRHYRSNRKKRIPASIGSWKDADGPESGTHWTRCQFCRSVEASMA